MIEYSLGDRNMTLHVRQHVATLREKENHGGFCSGHGQCQPFSFKVPLTLKSCFETTFIFVALS